MRRWWRVDDWFRPVNAGSTPNRGRQRAADTLALLLGFFAGTWAFREGLWQQVAGTVAVTFVASILLRLALRVPLWRTEPDKTPQNLPPYGEPPV